jgi:NAD(P)-dependent dehydrogenase (short-subunit alcohol dehydrogenase family)
MGNNERFQISIFGKTSFSANMTPNPTNFSFDKIPDQSNKTVIVTGGNTGIGFVTCLELARKGAHVYLAARSEERAKDAITRIQTQVPGAKVTWLQLDLQDLKQIQKAAKEFKQKEQKLDILINNAGIMAPPFALTKDGIETQFGTNHVGHHLFTRELLDVLKNTETPRVVNLSSVAHKWHPKEGIAFDDINNEKAMSNFARYGQSKLANLLFTRGLVKRHGDFLFANSVHPGVVRTELGRGIQKSLGWFFTAALTPLFKVFSLFAQISPEEGTLTTLYCATSPDIVKKNFKDKYFVPFAQEQEPLPIARDDALADKLWDFTEQLINEKLA